MPIMTAGVTKANEGMDGISWNILGQIYVPKQHAESSFSWHATFPVGTFVPPHIHPTQEEFVYMLEGRLDVILGRLGLQTGLIGLADQRFDLGQGLGAGRGLLRCGLGFLGEGAAGAEGENRGGEKGGLHEVTPSMRIEGSDPSMARTSARWMAGT